MSNAEERQLKSGASLASGSKSVRTAGRHTIEFFAVGGAVKRTRADHQITKLSLVQSLDQ